MLLPLVSAQPLIDIDAEDNNKEESKIEDNNIKKLELLLPLTVIYFISMKKAFNKKEVLPST